MFIAAGMADEDWLKVALKAMALGVGLYVIPLGMIANPALIQLETDFGGALLAFAQMCVALACISYALIAVRNPALKLILVAPGLLIVFLRLLG